MNEFLEVQKTQEGSGHCRLVGTRHGRHCPQGRESLVEAAGRIGASRTGSSLS
jgi:hypothetical protein